MGSLFILLACLIPSFFLASNAAEPSLVKPDDKNLPILNLCSNGIDPVYDFPRPRETVGDVDAGTLPTLVIPNLYDRVDILGETIDDAEANTASSSSTHDPVIPNSYGSSLPSGTTYSDVEASTTSVGTLAIPDPFASVHNLLRAADDVDASRVSTSSAHTRVIPNSSVGENIVSDHAILIEQALPEISQVSDQAILIEQALRAISQVSDHAIFIEQALPEISQVSDHAIFIEQALPKISQIPSSSSSHFVETPRNGRFSGRDGPFNLGETNIGLTFQASLALMLFHLQGSFSANTRSISFNLIGVSMIIGFTFSVIGIFLSKVRPRLATLGNYISLFSTAFGFFMMIETFLPDSFSWTVWPAFVFVFLAFVFALSRTE